MPKDIKQFIKANVNSRPVIVEVGSHYGEDSVKFLKILNPSKLYCFEPDPRNIAIFKKHIKDDRVELFELAVSDTDDDNVTLYQGYDAKVTEKVLNKYNWIDRRDYLDMKINASGATSLKKGHTLVSGGNTVQVRTTRLDTWCKENGVDHIDFIWIDVQGAERDVVNGFGDMADKIDYVWTEFGEMAYEGAMNRKQTIGLFSSLGFAVVRVCSDSKNKGNLLFRKI